MKTLITVILLSLAYATTYAQAPADSTKWSKFEKDMFGTPAEKREQDAISNKAGHELYRFIGYKWYYVDGLAGWLQMHGYSESDVRQPTKTLTQYIFMPKIHQGKVQPVRMNISIGKNDRTTRVLLTGPFNALAKIFLTYWPTDPQFNDEVALKGSSVAQKMLIDEKITFHNSAGSCSIVVSK
jgi:hypothetical protein